MRDKKQIRFTHSRFPLANSISSGVPLTLCPVIGRMKRRGESRPVGVGARTRQPRRGRAVRGRGGGRRLPRNHEKLKGAGVGPVTTLLRTGCWSFPERANRRLWLRTEMYFSFRDNPPASYAIFIVALRCRNERTPFFVTVNYYRLCLYRSRLAFTPINSNPVFV